MHWWSRSFRWSAFRVVTKTATVSLAGNRYQVDPSPVGRRVELRFDPESLASLSVYVEGRLTGIAIPYVIDRHVHPAVPQEAPPAGQVTRRPWRSLARAAMPSRSRPAATVTSSTAVSKTARLAADGAR
jgi:Mu transposase, C-terminal